MIQQETMASAVGAKTARACDICVRRRARWYCAPDDAFLCQSCDDSVHSANPLARRHERVRLNTASSTATAASSLPTWHRGPTKKPRTPRHRKKSPTNNHHHHLLVPELDTSTSMEEEDEEEEQLLHRVPVYEYDQYTSGAADLASGISHGFLPPSDFDMAEFAADVEALLGKGLDGEQSCGIEDLGLLINPHESDDSSAIKIEKQDEQELAEMEVIREPFELTFDYDSPLDLKVVVELTEEKKKKKECKMLLRLDYDAISSSWGSQGSPWMNGEKPNFNPNDDFWPLNTMGDYGDEVHENGRLGLMTGGQTAAIRDGGREARVSRYREKRRTRLFSKKIRYEVRKLNAEKRPRMKGRFVKRSSFS